MQWYLIYKTELISRLTNSGLAFAPTTQSLFSAFFRFSAFVTPPPVAALFTALVLVAGAAGITLIETGVPAFPPTFASAGPSGDGDGWRSLSLFINPMAFSVSFIGAGDADFLVPIGSVNGDAGGIEGEVLTVGLDVVDSGVTDVDASVLDDACATAGISNSAGRTRVACTLVINLARSQ